MRRLVDGGYPSLSVAEIARDLGLAQNAIYWYFPSKDHLLVAALQKIVDGVLAKKPRGDSTFKRIIWFTNRMEEFQSLRASMRERSAVSPIVADFDRKVTEGMKMLLSGALSETVVAARLDITTDAVMGFVEGVLAQSMTRKKRAEILRFGLERLAGVTDSAPP